MIEIIASQMEVGAELSHAYISLATGDTCRVHEFDHDSVYRQLSGPGRMEMIPNLPSQDLYLWMAEFTQGLPNDAVRNRLVQALSEVSAVWKFRNILYHDDALSRKWEKFKRQKLLETAISWMEALKAA